MKQNNIDILKLKEDSIYEYYKSLSEDDRIEFLYNLQDLEEYQEDEELIYIIDNFIQRLEEDLMYRQTFYWKIYNLIDDDNNYTNLGQLYKDLYTHHYLKALKLYLNFSNSEKDKNRVLYKNEKAYEYLQYFKYFIKHDDEKMLTKKI